MCRLRCKERREQGASQVQYLIGSLLPVSSYRYLLPLLLFSPFSSLLKAISPIAIDGDRCKFLIRQRLWKGKKSAFFRGTSGSPVPNISSSFSSFSSYCQRACFLSWPCRSRGGALLSLYVYIQPRYLNSKPTVFLSPLPSGYLVYMYGVSACSPNIRRISHLHVYTVSEENVGFHSLVYRHSSFSS